MDEQRRVLRVLIDPTASEETRQLIRHRLERIGHIQVVYTDDPRDAHVGIAGQVDVIDIAKLHAESRSLNERLMAELKADHDGNVAYATEQCAGDDPTPMRGNGRRTLRTNANGTMTWPEAKRNRSRK